MINLDFCNRPLPAPDNLFENPDFCYANGQIPLQLGSELQNYLTTSAPIGGLGHIVRLCKVMGDALMFSLRFSSRRDRLSRVDRLEASLPPTNNEILQHQWFCITSLLRETFDQIPDNLRNVDMLIDLFHAEMAMPRIGQYQFAIFALYHFCLLLLHIPSSMTLQLPIPIVPWADYSLKPWVQAANDVSRVAEALLNYPQTPVWVSSTFESVLFLSSNIHLLELVMINDQICQCMSCRVPIEHQEHLARERERILKRLDVNYRTMCLVEPLWQINEGVRLMFAEEIMQLGIPIPQNKMEK